MDTATKKEMKHIIPLSLVRFTPHRNLAIAFGAAVNSEEFKKLTEPYMKVFPHYPGLYDVVRT